MILTWLVLLAHLCDLGLSLHDTDSVSIISPLQVQIHQGQSVLLAHFSDLTLARFLGRGNVTNPERGSPSEGNVFA